MPKFTDVIRDGLQDHFNAGAQPTEAQFDALILAIQEGIELHDHDATGDGDGIATLAGILYLDLANGRVGVGVAPATGLHLYDGTATANLPTFTIDSTYTAGDVTGLPLANIIFASAGTPISAIRCYEPVVNEFGLAFGTYSAAALTTRMTITGAGVVNIANLAGVGVRAVVAAADGTLSAP